MNPTFDSAGRFDVKILSSVVTKSNKGTPQIEMRFKRGDGAEINGWMFLTDTPIDGNPEDTPFTRTLETLQKLGFDGNFVTLNDQLKDKSANIVCEFEAYQGRQRLRVKFINPPYTPPEPAEGSLLQQLTKKAFAAQGKPYFPGKTPQPQPAAASTADEDENPPF
ncbi:MAG: hypothetical protein Q7P63_01275 [Verrucomicrobiota bacterium JB022]|nr:hypothetical protein [Verrucomicrobiota bacterium JB022]